MSIIAALISTRDGVVASDGRKFGSADVHIESGQITVLRPAQIESDEFDKTFELEGRKIVGAFCGLVSFSGMTIGEHVVEIAAAIASRAQFTSVVEKVAEGLRTRIDCISDKEVMRALRKLDLLLVGGERLTRADMRIASIRIHTEDGVIKAATKIDSVAKGSPCWRSIYGDDNAQAAARGVFEANLSSSSDADFLTRLVREAIEVGISASGPHPQGSDLACGGRVFLRRTYYS